jgi:hypothetical protein
MDNLQVEVKESESLFSFKLGDYYKYGRSQDSIALKHIFGEFMRLAFFIETDDDIASITISRTVAANGPVYDEGIYMGISGDVLPGDNGKFTLRFIKVNRYGAEVALKFVLDH